MKFRGKTVEEGKWIEGDLIHYERKDLLAILPSDINLYDFADDIEEYKVIPESIGMSIGLKDKNKKEIFGSIEVGGKISKGGDIVKVYTIVEKGEDPIWLTHSIFYKNGTFGILPHSYLKLSAVWTIVPAFISKLLCKDDIEIIGNQLDNPELLEAPHAK